MTHTSQVLGADPRIPLTADTIRARLDLHAERIYHHLSACPMTLASLWHAIHGLVTDDNTRHVSPPTAMRVLRAWLFDRHRDLQVDADSRWYPRAHARRRPPVIAPGATP